jgi:hypothetical protein
MIDTFHVQTDRTPKCIFLQNHTLDDSNTVK